jgi:hypothetical protein
MTEKLTAILDQLEAQQQQPPPVPKGIRALGLLQMVYRGEITLSQQQIRAAIEALPFESPKLTALTVGHFEGSFADALERAIERSQRPLKLIEAKPVQPLPASELTRPFPRMKRRV